MGWAWAPCVQVASGRMATRSGMAEVELVEHDDDVVDARRPRGPRPRCRPRPCAGRPRAGSVGTGCSRSRRSSSPSSRSPSRPRCRSGRSVLGLDALAALPGIAAPMASAPDVAWTSPGDAGQLRADPHRSRLGPGRRPDPVGADRRLDELAARGRRPAPGRALDERPLERPGPGRRGQPRHRRPRPPARHPRPTPGQGIVVCLVTDSWQLTVSDDDTRARPRRGRLGAAAGVRRRDRRDGARPAPRAVGASFAAVGTDVVVAAYPGSGDGPAQRRAARPVDRDGTVERRPPAPRRRGRVGLPRPCSCSATRSASAGSGPPTLFTVDGERPAGARHRQRLEASRAPHHARGRQATTQLRDLDTGRVMDLGDARPPWIDTDDGSEPDLLILQSEDRLAGARPRDRAAGVAGRLAGGADPQPRRRRRHARAPGRRRADRHRPRAPASSSGAGRCPPTARAWSPTAAGCS